MNCYAMSKTNKNTRTLRKYIWQIWQSDETPKPKTQKRNLNALRYTTNLQLEFNEPLTLFSQPRLPAPPLPIALTVFANTKKKLQRQNKCAQESERAGGEERRATLS